MLVTQSFDYDGGRQVSLHVPRASPELLVIGGDGQLLANWGPSLEAAKAPPTLIVGVHRTYDPDEMARLREYSPGFAPEIFAVHERFFIDEVGGWVRSQFGALPPSRTIVAGVSASAEFALALGLRHPDIFGTIFAASPGAGYQPPTPLPDTLPRAYLTAGTNEPFFHANATRWHDALRAAGADTILTEQPGGHGDPFWQTEFIRMLSWAARGR